MRLACLVASSINRVCLEDINHFVVLPSNVKQRRPRRCRRHCLLLMENIPLSVFFLSTSYICFVPKNSMHEAAAFSPLLAVALFVFLPFVLLFFFINVLLYILRFLKQTQQASQQPANRSPTARHSFVSRQSCLKGSRFFPSLFCRKRKKTQSIRKSTTILLASSSLLSKEEQGEPPPRQFGHHKAFWR